MSNKNLFYPLMLCLGLTGCFYYEPALEKTQKEEPKAVQQAPAPKVFLGQGMMAYNPYPAQKADEPEQKKVLLPPGIVDFHNPNPAPQTSRPRRKVALPSGRIRHPMTTRQAFQNALGGQRYEQKSNGAEFTSLDIPAPSGALENSVEELLISIVGKEFSPQIEKITRGSSFSQYTLYKIKARPGSPVRSFENGIVTNTGQDPTDGLCVQVTYLLEKVMPMPLFIEYCNLGKISAAQLDRVKKSQKIGEMGNGDLFLAMGNFAEDGSILIPNPEQVFSEYLKAQRK